MAEKNAIGDETMRTDRILTYENGLLLMMSMTNAVVVFDRFSINYLAPAIVAEFHLNNTQVGLLSSGVSVAVATAGLFLARLADSSGRRKRILILTLVAFSLISGLSGFATSFLTLLGARILLGIPDGPIPPVAQSVVAIEASEHRRGLNMGVMQNLGSSIVGIGIGSIAFTQVAQAFGWRAAFFMSCIPGLLLALCIGRYMRPLRPERQIKSALAAGERGGATGTLSLLKSRNVVLCVILCGIYSAWLLVLGAFTPLYLVQVDGLAPTSMGFVIGLTGIAHALAGVGVPAISDRIGRKNAMTLMLFFCTVTPLVLLFVHGSAPLIAACLFVAAIGTGASPLISIVSAESVSERHVATTIALCIASGELFGGIVAPTLAGRAADRFGLAAPFWICLGCAILCGFVSLLLKETSTRESRMAARAQVVRASAETGSLSSVE